MLKDNLIETIKSLSNEKSIINTILFDSTTTPLFESNRNFQVDYDTLISKVNSLITLNKNYGKKCQEMELFCQGYKVFFFFLKQNTLVLITKGNIDFANIELSVTLAINKIKKTTTKPVIEDILEQNILKRKNSSKLNRNNLDISQQDISFIIKKVLVEIEGPLGNIIFTKSRREFGKLNELDKKSTNDFIDVISKSVSTSHREKFRTDALKISNEFFS